MSVWFVTVVPCRFMVLFVGWLVFLWFLLVRVCCVLADEFPFWVYLCFFRVLFVFDEVVLV